jgi:hypothetical protein
MVAGKRFAKLFYGRRAYPIVQLVNDASPKHAINYLAIFVLKKLA